MHYIQQLAVWSVACIFKTLKECTSWWQLIPCLVIGISMRLSVLPVAFRIFGRKCKSLLDKVTWLTSHLEASSRWHGKLCFFPPISFPRMVSDGSLNASHILLGALLLVVLSWSASFSFGLVGHNFESSQFDGVMWQRCAWIWTKHTTLLFGLNQKATSLYDTVVLSVASVAKMKIQKIMI